MFFLTEGISIFVKKNFRKAKPGVQTIFFLHGFGGSSNDWKETLPLFGTKFQFVAIDLPGFGKSSKPRRDKFYRTDFLIQLIDDILNELSVSNCAFVGYSMGGRLALHFANKFPEKVAALILESSSPGIKSKSEQLQRKKNDAELISFINASSLEDFFTFWQNQSLFASQKKLPTEKQHALFETKITSNSKTGLTNSLKNFGQGEMENLWSKLPEINNPVLLLSGELDAKYSAVQNEMNKLFPNSTHKIIEAAGHNLHLEKPQVFVNLVEEFLQISK